MLKKFCLWAAMLVAGAGAQPIEKGKFVLHNFTRPLGEETYDNERGGDTLVTHSVFQFTDRGTKVPLTATLRTAADFTPRHFEIRGQTSRISAIDAAVDIADGKAIVREKKDSRTAPVPLALFHDCWLRARTMQMTMPRYWAKSGKPKPLPVFPNASVTIEPRGTDTVALDGHDVQLQRYTITGLIWAAKHCGWIRTATLRRWCRSMLNSITSRRFASHTRRRLELS
jgi:hypothetical protein